MDEDIATQIRRAAEDGNLEALKHLVVKHNLTVATLSIHDSIAWQASQHGHLHILEWFFELLDAKLQSSDTESYHVVIQEAAEYGHLHILQWLATKPRYPADLTIDDNIAVRRAAKHGHLDIVKWLVTESGQDVDVTTVANEAVQVAAKFGYLEIVKWLVQESGQLVDVTTDNNYAVRWAADLGNLDVVKWLVHESGQAVELSAEGYYALREAAASGHLDVVKWIFEESGQEINDLEIRDWHLGMMLNPNIPRHPEVFAYLEETVAIIEVVGLDDFREARKGMRDAKTLRTKSKKL